MSRFRNIIILVAVSLLIPFSVAVSYAKPNAEPNFEDKALDQSLFSPTKVEKTGAASAKSGGGSMARTIFGLIIVVGAIFATQHLLKRWHRGKMGHRAGVANDAIDVLGTTVLAPGRALHLVRVGGEMLLIGATEHSISRISVVDQGQVKANEINGIGDQFDRLLTATSTSDTQQPALIGNGSESDKAPFMNRFIENLKMSTAR